MIEMQQWVLDSQMLICLCPESCSKVPRKKKRKTVSFPWSKPSTALLVHYLEQCLEQLLLVFTLVTCLEVEG